MVCVKSLVGDVKGRSLNQEQRSCLIESALGVESITKIHSLRRDLRDFPIDTVVKTLSFQCRGNGFDPWGTKIPHATWPKIKKEKKKEGM